MKRPSDPKARQKQFLSERGVVALALAAICAIYLAHVSMYDFISDDAFIALRYARNLIQGHGLVFNPGERVEGFTTLLWVLLLAGVGSLGMDLLAWSRILGVRAGLFLFRLLYFGDPLPNTYYAKAGASWAQVKRGLVYLAEYTMDHESIGLMIVPVGYFLLRGPRALRLLGAGVAAFWCASIWVGGDGLPMYRFALAPLPILLVLQAVLLERVYRHSASRLFRSHQLPKALLLLTVVVWGTVHVTPPAMGSHFVNYEYQKEVEVPRWKSVGLWLRENAAEGDGLAAVPIGAVSYYSGLIAYDMLGLTDRHIAHLDMPGMGLGWAGHEKHDGQYILGRRPTYLLLGNIDVTAQPRDPLGSPFIPYTNRSIFDREKDVYEGGLLLENYRPRSVRLETGEYFNFYELKQARP